MPNADDFLSFVGFNASHLYFDGQTIRPLPPPGEQTRLLVEDHEPKQSIIDMSLQALIDDDSPPASRLHSPTAGASALRGAADPTSAATAAATNSPNKKQRDVRQRLGADPVVDELRNYTTLLDKFSLHNFMIYNGQALRDTPEFQSFRRTYNHEWGSIAVIIAQLEKLLREHSVKLAIINGPCLYDLASLNLVTVERDELCSCISNIDQVGPQLKSMFGNDPAGGDGAAGDDGADGGHGGHKHRAAVVCQALIRKFLATRRVRRLRQRISAAIHIQSVARRRIHRRVGLARMRLSAVESEERWAQNREKLTRLWTSLHADSSLSTVGTSATQQRLVIHIPSITAAEYLRLDLDNMRAIQNATIGCLAQLADPDVTVVLVTPCQLGPSELAYHDKFLALLGISTLPKRLHFVVPEMLPRLPEHLPLAQVLWSSPAALRRIKGFVRKCPNAAYIVPSSVSWAEKKIAHVLNVPLLAPNPSMAETLRSRSYGKRIFSEASVNIPVGAHGIFSTDDFLVALTRLVACNLHVRRWLFRLNYDLNNESVVVLDTTKIPIVGVLRGEQKLLFESTNNQTGSWFTKNVQLSVRKRLLAVLTVEVPSKAVICRRDLYGSWDRYCKHAARVGMVIEAEPIEKLGYVDSMAFIDPLGEVSWYGGADVVTDDKHQAQTFITPQTLTPPAALEGATRAVATHLFGKLGVIGHVTVKFCAFWDGLDNIPRVWAVGLHFGLTPQFGAAVSAAIAVDPTVPVPRSLLPPLPADGEFPGCAELCCAVLCCAVLCRGCLLSAVCCLTPPLPFLPPTPLLSSSGRCMVHVPIAIHEQLRGSRDDLFFKLCRMRGLAFDTAQRTGVLFFLVDTIVGGAISFVCVAHSRFRALELAVQCLSFVTTQFGKERNQGHGVADCRNLCSILLFLRKAHKAEEKRVGGLVRS